MQSLPVLLRGRGLSFKLLPADDGNSANTYLTIAPAVRSVCGTAEAYQLPSRTLGASSSSILALALSDVPDGLLGTTQMDCYSACTPAGACILDAPQSTLEQSG